MKEFDAVAAPLMLRFSHWTNTGEVKSPRCTFSKKNAFKKERKSSCGSCNTGQVGTRLIDDGILSIHQIQILEPCFVQCDIFLAA